MTEAGPVDRIALLEHELEQRTRRMHQLMGEREQLAALLSGRDAEIQRLNRELGARAALDPGPRRRPAAPARGAAAGLWHGIRGLWPRPRPPAPVTRAPTPPVEAALAAPALTPWTKEGPPRPILAAVIYGLQAAEIERIVEVALGHGRQHGLLPLLLTDDDDFRVFRGRRLIVEFLPPEATHGPSPAERDWELYLLRRLALIRQKWQPVRIIAFGARATEVVQLWQESPFEETPIPALQEARSGSQDAASAAARSGQSKAKGRA